MQGSNNGMFKLDGAVAVVTGGASGIGQAVAEMFASHGGCVHILDLNKKQAESIAAESGNQVAQGGTERFPQDHCPRVRSASGNSG
jgi:NAD(P)-dependent dehydrogenase (short-subunit alcohol dehydrogenase family)